MSYRSSRSSEVRPLDRKILFWVTIVIMVVVGVAAFALRQVMFEYWPVAPPGIQRVKILPGTAMPQIADQLEKAGVIGNAKRFGRLVRWRSVAQKLKAGEYEFSKAATPTEILDRLVAGDTIKIRLTIPEGLTMREIAVRVAATGIATEQELISLATSRDYIHKLGVQADSLEGYLFPETYTVTTTTAPEEILKVMVSEFERELTPEILNAAKGHGLDRHELVTLASIIQKETGSNDEMPQISAVFHNRLQRGMPLQADPTVIYGIRNFNGNLTRHDLQTPTPYNTYTRSGLPPGPIASPGLAALHAAAFPSASKSLYFVSRGDGSHEFNSTLEAHNRAVHRYQLHR